jgi:xylose isomerase
MNKFGYRFSFGPWNISEGADPFGPPIRATRSFDEKLKFYKSLEFDAVQFHDDDAVPNLDEKSAAQIRKEARAMRKKLADNGLVAEFTAPRLWENPLWVDGAFTSNNAKARAAAIERSKKCLDIANELGADLVVLWLAREGTYIRESKTIGRATQQLLDAVNTLLDYDKKMRFVIEPKPNEPMDLAYLPTIGHGLALGFQTKDARRVGVLVESAHAILAGLDPSDEMGFALHFGKLWSVHLNDQNGLKYDQDKAFGSVDLRRAFNQVRVLDEAQYWKIGMVGLDVKAMRTQPAEIATKHLRNSMEIFLRLVEISRSLDRKMIGKLIEARDYEEVERMVVGALMGR